LQPNLETQKKQVTAWCDLVLAYHKHHKIYTLDVKEAVSSPIFNNSKIQRKLSEEEVTKILDALSAK
ncbi:putative vacuolar protein-sorting-associated protein 25, partial [Apostichopus japonicus]